MLAPDPNGPLEFWSNIWARPHNHRADAEWVTEIRGAFDNIQRQEKLHISAKDLKKTLCKLSLLKTAGPDGVQGYCVKNFTSLNEWMMKQCRVCYVT